MGQKLVLRLENQARRLSLGKKLLPRNFVLDRRSDGKLPLVKIDIHQAPALAKGSGEAAEVRHRYATPSGK